MIRIGSLFTRLIPVAAIPKTCFSQATRAMCDGQISSSQTTNHVFMLQPGCFKGNPETLKDNAFQKTLKGLSDDEIQEKATVEFKALVKVLQDASVTVDVIPDKLKKSEDAVFPNNWISFHSGHESKPKIVVYPMMSKNRRLERDPQIVSHWVKILNADLVDYTHYEAEGKFLEGTGSMVLDRTNRVAYASLSNRTNLSVLTDFCRDLNYKPVVFEAFTLGNDASQKPQPIYHTNVMMCIGDTFAVVGLESILNEKERDTVRKSLEETGREVIPLTLQQVNQFAGNMLQLCGQDGNKYVVMSSEAFSAFTAEQRSRIEGHCKCILHSQLDTIETLGGGSARCMIAELFPPL